MSDAQAVVPVVSLLDQLKLTHADFVKQRDLAQQNLNQLVGAIYACEIMIQKHVDDAANLKGLSERNLGEQRNGEVNNKTQE
jgi:hypothetical protein